MKYLWRKICPFFSKAIHRVQVVYDLNAMAHDYQLGLISYEEYITAMSASEEYFKHRWESVQWALDNLP